MRRLFLASLLALPVLIGCAASELTNPEVRAVFFEHEGTLLDPPAREAVGEIATLARRHPGAAVRLQGYANTEPTAFPGGNLALSRARGEAVAAALREAGVAATRISVLPVGATAVALSPVESRRVEIRLGG